MSSIIKISLIIIAILLVAGIYFLFTNEEIFFSQDQPSKTISTGINQEEIEKIHRIIWEAEKARCMGFLSQNRDEYNSIMNSLYFSEEARERINLDWRNLPLVDCEVLDIKFTELNTPKELSDRVFFMTVTEKKITYEDSEINTGISDKLYFLKRDTADKWKIESDIDLIGPQEMAEAVKDIIQQLKEKDRKQK